LKHDHKEAIDRIIESVESDKKTNARSLILKLMEKTDRNSFLTLIGVLDSAQQMYSVRTPRDDYSPDSMYHFLQNVSAVYAPLSNIGVKGLTKLLDELKEAPSLLTRQIGCMEPIVKGAEDHPWYNNHHPILNGSRNGNGAVRSDLAYKHRL